MRKHRYVALAMVGVVVLASGCGFLQRVQDIGEDVVGAAEETYAERGDDLKAKAEDAASGNPVSIVAFGGALATAAAVFITKFIKRRKQKAGP